MASHQEATQLAESPKPKKAVTVKVARALNKGSASIPVSLFASKERVLRERWDVRKNSILDGPLSRWRSATDPGAHFQAIEAFIALLGDEEFLLLSGTDVTTRGNVRLARTDAPYWEALENLYPLFASAITVQAVIKKNLEVWTLDMGGHYTDSGVRVTNGDIATLMEAMGYGQPGVIGGRVTDAEHGLSITYSPNGSRGDPSPAILIKRRPRAGAQ